MRTATRPWNSPPITVSGLERPADWRDHAACRGMDTDMFYPDGRGAVLTRAIETAQQICAQCPVRTQCADAADTQHERYGIWGGQYLETRYRRRLCKHCGTAYTPNNTGQRYCGRACAKAQHDAQKADYEKRKRTRR